jgi:hypothetical protein
MEEVKAGIVGERRESDEEEEVQSISFDDRSRALYDDDEIDKKERASIREKEYEGVRIDRIDCRINLIKMIAAVSSAVSVVP